MIKKHLAWITGLLVILGALMAMRPSAKVRGFDVDGFGRIPVLEGGRVKPLDSLARNTLLMIRSQQSFHYQGRSVSAEEWMLDTLFRPTEADKYPIFVINDPDVLGLIGEKQSTNRYYSFERLAPHLGEIQKQAQAAEPVAAQVRTRFQSAVVNLFDRVYLYYRMKNTLQLEDIQGGLASELQNLTHPQAPEHHKALSNFAFFRPLAASGTEGWKSVGEGLSASTGAGAFPPGLVPLAKLGAAYTLNNPEAFNASLEELRKANAGLSQDALDHADREIRFNRAQPFLLGIVAYVLAFLVLALSWMGNTALLQRAAFGLLAGGAAVHTVGLAFRVILQGRPPVTNLYSSAIFVGWGAVILGLILERLYRKGFGTAVAAASGMASLIVAQNLAESGDTMEMMRAVLDSNFWLATHVITITIGYSGTFLAGALAIGYTLWKHLAPDPDPETGKNLLSMTYGIICFSLFFSFVGTVLGGIWADQSWGRFWGWDPKENGALLIVLWNSIILHARWAGYVRERGIMAMAIFGNVITSLSWFGVNMLGVGLHSYGFMDQAFVALMSFIASQGLFMVFCLLPRKFWKGPELSGGR